MPRPAARSDTSGFKLSLLNRVMAQPWAIRRESLDLITQMIISSETPVTRKVQSWDGEEREQASQPGYIPLSDEAWEVASAGNLPQLPPNHYVFLIWGTLGRAWSTWERWLFDAVEVDELTAALTNSPAGSVNHLWFRSPGGIVTGIPETAQAMRRIQETKTLNAFSDDLCCSAAYWLASQCGQIHGTPTAFFGSIGVYSASYDYCKMLEDLGIKLELFRSGQFKGRGLMGLPLSDADRSQLQAQVMEMFGLFTADILDFRKITEDDMQGQAIRGQEAMRANLLDTFHESAAAYFASLS